MPSDYLKDLVDHKSRVARYLQVAAHIMMERTVNYGDIAIYPESNEAMNLFDLFDVACKFRRDGRQFLPAGHYLFELSGQTYQICKHTAYFYLSYCQEYDIAHWRSFAVTSLFQRAAVHDNSKFADPEFALYEQAFPDLQKYAYGTEEFKATLATIQPAIDHHYQVNDHHPEHFPGGIPDMHAVQTIEMTADWLAASERSQRNVYEGLEINKRRFGIDDQLARVLTNTIDQLKGPALTQAIHQPEWEKR